ncbi:MAG: hypothetical protein AAGC56_06340 [Pseudomonadota bacterium]
MLGLANLRLENYYAAIAAATSLPEGDRKALLTSQAAWRAGEWRRASAAFAAMSPSIMGEKLAIQYALAAHMAGEARVPKLAAAVLEEDNPDALAGLRRLFAPSPEGSVLARGRDAVLAADEELQLIAEALGDG